MTETRLKSTNASNPKVLIGLSVFFVLTGGMITDPLAGLICFVLAGVFALIATIRRRRLLRYISLLLLIIIIALAVSKFPEARHHLRVYKSKTVTGNIK